MRFRRKRRRYGRRPIRRGRMRRRRTGRIRIGYRV